MSADSNVTVFHSSSKRLVVYDDHSQDFTVTNTVDVCDSCGQKLPGPDNFTHQDYFSRLHEHHNASNSRNDGYYAKFFVELERIGSGSFGSVYKAMHVLHDVELGVFAVKKVALTDDPAWIKKAFKEVQALQKINHPNIVMYKHTWIEEAKVSDFGPVLPCLFVVMEFANAGNLDTVIWPSGFDKGAAVLRESFILQIFEELVKGVSHLHHLGLVHRDIKPGNILFSKETDYLSGNEYVKVLLADLGQTESLDIGERLPRTGYTGTMLYSAPELLESSSDYDQKCDIYSLGIVLYTMAFGFAPYQNLDGYSRFDSSEELLHQILLDSEVPIPSSSKRSHEFITLIKELTQPDPRDRPGIDLVLRVVEGLLVRAKSHVPSREKKLMFLASGHSEPPVPLPRIQNRSLTPVRRSSQRSVSPRTRTLSIEARKPDPLLLPPSPDRTPLVTDKTYRLALGMAGSFIRLHMLFECAYGFASVLPLLGLGMCWTYLDVESVAALPVIEFLWTHAALWACSSSHTSFNSLLNLLILLLSCLCLWALVPSNKPKTD